MTIHEIILVDDDEIVRYLTKRVIESTNLVEVVKVFSNATDAIAFLKNNAGNLGNLPEIILLDINMPIIDGWGFIEEYIKLKPKLGQKMALFLLSSSICPADLKRAKNLSDVSDYIVKPMSADKLQRVIKIYEEKCQINDKTH